MRKNVLCVDDVGTTKTEFSSLLKSVDVDLIGVKNAEEAIGLLRENKFKISLILWAVNKDDESGFDAIRRVRRSEHAGHIPLAVVSSFVDRKHIVQTIECGAVEYIARPYDEISVLQKLCRLMNVHFRGSDVYGDDFLTLSFNELLSRELKSASRGNHQISIMMATVVCDKPEEVIWEDPQGIIGTVCKVLKTRLRETDAAFRYGKGNLLMLLPFTGKEGMRAVEQKLYDIFHSHTLIVQKNKGYKLVVKGVTFPDDSKVKDKLLDKLERDFHMACSQTASALDTNGR